MNKSFVYNQEKHTYTLDGREMTGVTTVLRVAGDKSGLIQWAANLAAAEGIMTETPVGWHDAYNALIEKYGKLDYNVARELDTLFPGFKKARTAHAKRRDDAADLGQEAHKICEEYELGLLERSRYSDEALQRAQPYIDWYDATVASTAFVEMPLFSRSMFVGGTPDGGFTLKDGKNLINDKKFKGGILSPEAFWQMSAYRSMIAEMAQDEETTIRLKFEDGTVKEYANPKEYLASIGGIQWDGSVVVLVDSNKIIKPMYRFAHEQDLEAFRAALTIYRELQAFKT